MRQVIVVVCGMLFSAFICWDAGRTHEHLFNRPSPVVVTRWADPMKAYRDELWGQANLARQQGHQREWIIALSRIKALQDVEEDVLRVQARSSPEEFVPD